jgi:hypothetical protein
MIDPAVFADRTDDLRSKAKISGGERHFLTNGPDEAKQFAGDRGFRTTARLRSKMPAATNSDPRIASARTPRRHSPSRAYQRVPRISRSCYLIQKVVPRPGCRTWWFMASPQR